MTRRRAWTGLAVVLALLAGSPGGGDAAAQEGTFRLVGPSQQREQVPVSRHRGYAAVPAATLERIGWTLEVESRTVRARLDEDVRLVIHPGTPFLTWNGDVLQLVAAPYFFGERLYVPLQLLTDVLPERLEEDYAADPRSRSVVVRRGEHWTPATAGREPGPEPPEPRAVTSEEERGVVVVVDPGHGGRDVGAQGPGGVVEKDITLGVALALARELEDEPGIEVHLTRSEDRFVPLWERGEKATRWKGERPGVFVSLHVNAVSRSRSTRGFETYFLSEARTAHERRVAALENASMEMESTDGDGGASGENPDLSFILNDLRNRDHQHWSALLAEEVQKQLAPIHPGPNRGVKQGPFAVITNALMPSVLVELGFVTNGSEARLLSRKSFQEDAAAALAEAIRSFFRSYPPGTEVTAGGSG